MVVFKIIYKAKKINSCEVKIRSAACQNCLQGLCMSGKAVTRQNFVPGAIVSDGFEPRKLIRLGIQDTCYSKGETGDERLDYLHYCFFRYACE